MASSPDPGGGVPALTASLVSHTAIWDLDSGRIVRVTETTEETTGTGSGPEGPILISGSRTSSPDSVASHPAPAEGSFNPSPSSSSDTRRGCPDDVMDVAVGMESTCAASAPSGVELFGVGSQPVALEGSQCERANTVISDPAQVTVALAPSGDSVHGGAGRRGGGAGRGFLTRARVLLPSLTSALRRPRGRLPFCHCLFATVAAATLLLCLFRLTPIPVPTPSFAYAVAVPPGMGFARQEKDCNKSSYVDYETDASKLKNSRLADVHGEITDSASATGTAVAVGNTVSNTGSASANTEARGDTFGGAAVGNTASGKSVHNSPTRKIFGDNAGDNLLGQALDNTGSGKDFGNTVGNGVADKNGNNVGDNAISNGGIIPISNLVSATSKTSGKSPGIISKNNVGNTGGNSGTGYADDPLTVPLLQVDTVATAEEAEGSNIMKIAGMKIFKSYVKNKNEAEKNKLKEERSPSKNLTAPADPEASRVGPLIDLYPGGFDDPCPALVDRCRRLPGPTALALVHSAPGHAAARRAVRETWVAAAKNKVFDKTFAGNLDNDTWLAVGFLVARTNDPELEEALLEEQQTYGDLIRPSFQDAYRNLTLKSIAMLEWFTMYCRDAKMLLKVDDDVAISPERLFRFSRERASTKSSLFGKVLRRRAPFRSPANKYYTSTRQWPKNKAFPDFAQGPAYMVSGDAVPRLLSVATRKRNPIKFLPVEDVLMSGVLAMEANVTVRTISLWLGRMITEKELKVVGPACYKPRELAVHPVPWHRLAEVVRRSRGICPKMAPSNMTFPKMAPAKKTPPNVALPKKAPAKTDVTHNTVAVASDMKVR